jgi:hypothetical protein
VIHDGDQHPVGAPAADGAHEPLGDRIHPGRSRSGESRVDPDRPEHGVERRSELRIPISVQMGEAMPAFWRSAVKSRANCVARASVGYLYYVKTLHWP